ncbi:IQ motif, EF-hand binding site [Phytophthora cinnamomi]|uniref:IQ motif, EF-hand binding site n=1 Tax=Phytophthora cinnamomi TaxID=4785 RepID=UPI00355A10F6|nr:IQ motif, EF-hand binding site [Phytophthora cinnamomi]
MSTENQAATCIQARFRGIRWRRQQRRGIRAVTKLQALQRGRFTRREFAELRDFSREQESFQQATRRRQIRIWRNEQELYFLQHTNGADLERSVAAPRVDNAVDIDPSDRIYTFDLFGFASTDAKAQGVRFNQWRRDEKNVDSSQPSLSLFLTQDELQASASASTPPSPDDEAFVSRRKKIQERIKLVSAELVFHGRKETSYQLNS